MDEFHLSVVRGAAAREKDAPSHARELTAYLVDCSHAMYRAYRGPLPGLQGMTLFQAALKQVSDVVASRLAHGVEDEITIVFFNRGVHVWHAAGPPSLALLERLDDLALGSSKRGILGKEGDQQERHVSLLESLRDALVASVLEFPGEEWSSYKVEVSLVVAVWTADNTGGCCDDNDPLLRTISELVNRRSIKLHVILLDDFKLDVPRQNVCDTSTVWAKLCSLNLSVDHNTRSIVSNPFSLSTSTKLISHTDPIKMMRLSGSSRHTSFVVPWHVGSFGVLDVRFFSLTSPAWPRCMGSTKWIDASDSSILVGKIGGQIPPPAEDVLVGNQQEDPGGLPFYPKPVGKKESSAPRIVMTSDIVENLKYPVPFRRAFLTGFKTRKWLADEWQLREAYFIRPHEDASLDARKRFKALHDVMSEQNVLAVCGLIKSEQSEPRLTAVLPCSSKETGQALGFSMMELPFADDLRHPEGVVEALGEPQNCHAMGSACAEKLVDLHRLERSAMPGVAPHPHLRQHFATIQSLVLDRPLEDGVHASQAGNDCGSDVHRMSRELVRTWADFKRLHSL